MDEKERRRITTIVENADHMTLDEIDNALQNKPRVVNWSPLWIAIGIVCVLVIVAGTRTGGGKNALAVLLFLGIPIIGIAILRVHNDKGNRLRGSLRNPR